MLKSFGMISLLTLLWGCQPLTGVYHTVKEGETIARISDVYSVDEIYIARLNDIGNSDDIRTGQKIFIPGVEKVRVVGKPTPPQVKKSSTGDRNANRTVEPKSSSAPVTKPTTGKFGWPVQGKVTKDFGQGKTDAGKGIEISVPAGTPVLSSESGQVIYSGNGINGFGNLIIVKHEDSYFTVYGYNSRNLVENGDFIGKGEKIASSGSPPKGGPPRLYFEIRKGKRVVNPFSYLP